RCLDLLKDYDYEIRYHSVKANVVADAFSRKERKKVTRVHSLRMIVKSDLFDRIKAVHEEELKEENWKISELHLTFPILKMIAKELRLVKEESTFLFKVMSRIYY
nr:putative reverse transcriptase domain-containing protein [Tanacetum cinerariifolium]